MKQQNTPETLNRHVHELAAAFHVEIIPYLSMVNSYANYTEDGQPQIHIEEVRNDSLYAIALHELGHLLSPLGTIRRYEPPFPSWNVLLKMPLPEVFEIIHRQESLIITEEEAAWEWAQHYALCWTPEMEEQKQKGLKSYRDGLLTQGSSRIGGDFIEAA